MVSLSEGRDGGRQEGGFFFNEPSISQPPEDDDLLLTHSLQADEEPHFRKCNTLWVAVLQIILIILFTVNSVILPYVIEPRVHESSTTSKQLEEAFVVIAIGQPAVWLLLFVADRWLQFKHTVLSHHGYLDFTQRTRHIRRTAEFMFSVGNAFMVILVILRYNTMKYNDATSMPGSAVTPSIHGVNYQQMIIGVESLVALFACLRYSMLVYQFNQAQSPPDAEQEEQMIAVMQPSTHLPDVGYRDNQYVDALLERQADMIRYLKHHTEHLSRRILKLRVAQLEGQRLGSLQC